MTYSSDPNHLNLLHILLSCKRNGLLIPPNILFCLTYIVIEAVFTQSMTPSCPQSCCHQPAGGGKMSLRAAHGFD